jgi:hypothetical protein
LWYQAFGPKVVLQNSRTAHPSFISPARLANGKPITLFFRLAVIDNARAISWIKKLKVKVTDMPTGRLNDTGITACSDASTNSLACPVAGFPGQDAQSGRDFTHNDDKDGHAGFSFTKISSSGKPLPANAKTWNCVQDNVTGLMWEVKTADGGLHDTNWTYSWYEPDNTKNSGGAGIQNGGSCNNTSDCDTAGYVKKVNTMGWCGAKDWRMPTKTELLSIVSYDRSDPAIDTAYFPNTIGSLMFWSSSPLVGYGYYAWFVLFDYGYAYWNFNEYGNYQVRLVRSGQ